jgi:hypothetical protein
MQVRASNWLARSNKRSWRKQAQSIANGSGSANCLNTLACLKGRYAPGCDCRLIRFRRRKLAQKSWSGDRSSIPGLDGTGSSR